MMDKKRFSFLLAAIAALCGVLLCACADGGKTPEGKPPVGPPDTPIVDPPIDDDPPEDVKIQGDKFFLRAEGADVLNGDGERIILRGINIGGLFVTEHWMTGFMYGKTPSNDYRSLTKTFIDRFGEQKTKELWAEYQANWWCEQDFINCAEMGFNVIRLPFTYMNVDFDAVSSYDNAGKNYDFSMLDAFVAKAAEYGMYTILDLHGAYGSQNGQDHSGQIMNNVRDVTYYTDARMKSLTVKLWQALAEHYKDEPAVAGYDILNEPGEKAGVTGKLHWDHFDEIYKAIRAVDQKHIVIFESCWDAENLPRRSTYGWNNCMYSFHHYAGTDLTLEQYKASWDGKIADITATHTDVPLQMGEFTNYNSPDQWDYVLELMRNNGWHWTAWTYKVWGNMPWGVVNIRGGNADKIDASADDYDTILQKFKLLKTGLDASVKFTFANGVTLEQIYKNHCVVKKYKRVLADGTYSVLNDDGFMGVRKMSGVGDALYLTDNAQNAKPLTVTSTGFIDGSVYLATASRLSVASHNGKLYCVAGGDGNGDSPYFYAERVDDAYRFISARSGMYLRVGDDGVIYADGTADVATAFYCIKTDG